MNIISMLSCYNKNILKDLPKLRIGSYKVYKLNKTDSIEFTKVSDSKFEIGIKECHILNPAFYIGPITYILNSFGIEFKCIKKFETHYSRSKSIVNQDSLEYDINGMVQYLKTIEELPNIRIGDEPYLKIIY